jgi:haloalkane dehalogenase
LVAFSDSDPMTGALAPIFKRQLPGARGYPHPVYRGASHFVPEDSGLELANDIVAFIAETLNR